MTKNVATSYSINKNTGLFLPVIYQPVALSPKIYTEPPYDTFDLSVCNPSKT